MVHAIVSSFFEGNIIISEKSLNSEITKIRCIIAAVNSDLLWILLKSVFS